MLRCVYIIQKENKLFSKNYMTDFSKQRIIDTCITKLLFNYLLLSHQNVVRRENVL